uniref:Fibronectin n=1 Tax=Amphimedon queenslandica TaxID=400682 RepID=A0A1X7V4D5_AMPQE
MHDGICYGNGSYFWDNHVNAVTEAISCVIPGTNLTTGQWVRVADPDDPVDCNSNSDSDPFHCTNVTSPANLSLYLAQSLPAAQEGWYKCCLPTDCSHPNTYIIFANIFKYAEIESFTVAGLSSDMTVYPQEYKLNCTKIGHTSYSISMSIGSTALVNYIGCYDQFAICPGTVLVSSTNTIRYTVDITWDGMNVSSGSIRQSTTGDQMYQCVLDNIGGADRIRTLTIKVPATAPSSLTEINKTATTITVSWTALDSSDADGYVINVTSDTDTVQTVQVEGSSNNTITVNGLRVLTTYSITVRAYQQLLGPASSTISVQTSPVINSINWTLASSITQLNNTQYRIDCLTTTDIDPSTDVYWLVNGVMKNNSNYSSIDVLTYNNTLLVYPDPLGESVNVTCIAMIGGVNYNQSVILHAPSGPPNNVRGFILNANSIKVNWTNSSEINGYVIEYTTGGVTRNVVSTSEDELVLPNLSPMSTYTISVYSYIDLPSVNSTVTVLKFDVPSPVTSFSVSNVSTTGITVSWTIPSSDNYVTYYTISYTPSCPQLSSLNETVSVAPHQSTTTYSYTLIGLYSGMNYTITVRAGNVLGGSDPSFINENTLPIVPTGIPAGYLFLLQPVNNLTWNEVNCSQRNGLVIGYTVIISNSSITYNLTSTERYIILNDLVFGTEADDDISMQVCEPYGIHKTKLSEENEGVYDECQTSPEDVYEHSSIRPTPIECGLPGATLNGGRWIGPSGAIPCGIGYIQNVQCTTGSGANLSVFINPANGFLRAPGDGWYKCCLPTDCSDPNANIIFANIFRYAQIESFTVADLPSDMTVYPQEYKLNCIKIGHNRYGISKSIGSTALASYTNCFDGSNSCSGTVLDSITNTLRYTVTITWDGMTVSSGSISQSTTGDQMYQYILDNLSGGDDRTRYLTIKVPATAPSSLTEVNKTATTITVIWTALDSSDADGYVVNVTSDTDTVQTVQVEGTSNNTITLNGLRGGTTYNITVRAYQQLLGPASTISVQTLPGI